MKYTALVLSIITALFYTADAQTSNWQNYTDMKNIRSAAYYSAEGGLKGVWAATTGGAFFYDLNDDNYRTFHKVDGFSGSSMTSVAVDSKGRIWFGSSSGIIDIYDPSSNTNNQMLDIYNSSLQQKGINDFLISGDSIFIATDYGISVININNFIFADTYSRFGSLSSNIKVNTLIKGNLIYAALENAVAVQKPGTTNLASPDAWNILTLTYNNQARKINYITEFNGNILAASDYGVFILSGNTFIPYITELISQNINKLKVSDGILYIISGKKLFSYNGQLNEIIQNETIINNIFSSEAGLFISTEDGLLQINEGQITKVIKPNAPYTNLFSSLSVDGNGNLWSASGRDVTGRGFFKLKNNEWTNYNISGNPEILTNAYYNTTSYGDEVYFGSWGYGFLKIKDNNFLQFNASNTPMEGISENPDFVVIGGLAKDSRNNLWILNYASVTLENLHLLTPDSTWYNFKIPAMQNQYIAENFGLVIDQQDTKWFFSQSSNRPGIFYFHENNTYDNTADDKSGYISDGLNGEVLSLSLIHI